MAIAGPFADLTVEAAMRGEGVTLISGACPTGADRMAEEIALGLGWTVEIHPAQWERYGKAAGFIRNAFMVSECAPDVCYAFVRNHSKGASMTVALAATAGIPTVVTRA